MLSRLEVRGEFAMRFLRLVLSLGAALLVITAFPWVSLNAQR